MLICDGKTHAYIYGGGGKGLLARLYIGLNHFFKWQHLSSHRQFLSCLMVLSAAIRPKKTRSKPCYGNELEDLNLRKYEKIP